MENQIFNLQDISKFIVKLLFCNTHIYIDNSQRQMWEMFQFQFCTGPLQKLRSFLEISDN